MKKMRKFKKNESMVVILCLGLALLVGCGAKLGEEFTQEVNTLEGAVLTVDEVSVEGAAYTISNQSEKDLSYGQDYSLLIRKDDKWYQVEPERPVAVTLEILTVPAGGSDSQSVSWKDAYGKLSAGSYRLLKSVSDTEQSCYLAGEFEIK